MRCTMMAMAVALSGATPAGASIVGADSHGFEVRSTIEVPVAPAQALAAFGQLGSWWAQEHSLSGKPGRLTLDLRPGGCFCERLDGGTSFEHLRVALYQPGDRIVLTGSLGPLLFEATSGVMEVRAVKSGSGSTVTIDYRVAGFARGNGTEFAVAVDAVLRDQAERLRAFAAKGKR